MISVLNRAPDTSSTLPSSTLGGFKIPDSLVFPSFPGILNSMLISFFAIQSLSTKPSTEVQTGKNPHVNHIKTRLQGQAKEKSKSCEKILPGYTWLLLNKTEVLFLHKHIISKFPRPNSSPLTFVGSLPVHVTCS